uniref:Ubiquinone/menaquinone biosynthesis methyltransferase n=1 Tax=Hydrogenovibrio crunogenus (strain DSM 25203 / XCL-2) TaxID=317025 RepID=Q31EY5_HYDCU
MTKTLEQTQQQILKHHGGDGAHARQMITNSYDRRHDEAFWQFWDDVMALNHQPKDGVLDMGAGIGQFVKDCAERYPESKIYGIEAAPYMLQNPLALPDNAVLLVDDLNQPQAEMAPGSLSMVMANMVVHELIQPIKMFKAAYEWLKPGGRLCVIDVVRQPLEAYLNQRYADTQVWGDQTSVADLEDAFEHFQEHNRYHLDDIVFMLTLGGFKLIEKTPQREGRFVRIVVEK